MIFTLNKLARGGAKSKIFRVPNFIEIYVMRSLKIAFDLNLVPKTHPDLEFEKSEIIKKVKFSTYS